MSSLIVSRQQVWAAFDRWVDAAVAHLPNIAFAIAVFVLATIVASLARRSAKRAVTRASGDERAGSSWGRIVQYSVLLLGTVATLAVAGVSLSALMVAVGALGFGLAFALQDIIANFMAGLVLLTTHPFARDDAVEVNGVEGRVEEISIRSTKLNTFDGVKVEVPNREVLANNITVYTFHPTRRFDVAVGIGYDDDIQGALETALEAAGAVEDVLSDPSPEAFVTELGDSSVNLNVRFWVNRTDRATMLETKGEVARAVKEALDEAGYDIPFPIRTVYMHGEEADEANAAVPEEAA